MMNFNQKRNAWANEPLIRVDAGESASVKTGLMSPPHKIGYFIGLALPMMLPCYANAACPYSGGRVYN